MAAENYETYGFKLNSIIKKIVAELDILSNCTKTEAISHNVHINRQKLGT